jgi:vacuolar-type H+-ATPase subunit C/Vma6
MRKPSRLAYAYAVGRVRALEIKLIEKAVFREASEGKDFSSVIKIISEAGDFQEEIGNVRSSDDLDAVIEKEEENLDRLMSELLLEEDISSIIEEDSHPDKALSVAYRTDYDFIQDYLRHKIDLMNLKILSRAKYLMLPSEKFHSLVLKGGFVDERILIQNYELTFSEIGERLGGSDYQNLWSEATDVLEEKETFVELELRIEDFLMTYLRRAKYIVFGPEPIYAYVLARKRELSLLRLVGVGKLNQIPIELLKQRISETYV